MEKIFYPNKWFVLFCGLLVLVWIVLQSVANMRIAEHAKLVGQHIFSWSWPDRRWLSAAQITKADVLHRTGTDAVVKIEGRQVLTMPGAGSQIDSGSSKSEVVDCAATLTFYKASNNWVLGKVELK